MNALRGSGIIMPSSVWKFSRIAQITRVVAHMVAFSMCTNSAFKKTETMVNQTLYGQYRLPSILPQNSGVALYLVHHFLSLPVANTQAASLVICAV